MSDGLLAWNWDRYPADAYARGVLALVDLSQVTLVIKNREQLAQLPLLAHVRSLDITGAFSSADLVARLEGHTIEIIRLTDNKLITDLAFLDCCGAHLKQVLIQECPAVQSLAHLAELDALEVVQLDNVPVSAADVAAMARIPQLRSLDIYYPVLEQRPLDLTPLRAVEGLDLTVEGHGRSQITNYL